MSNETVRDQIKTLLAEFPYLNLAALSRQTGVSRQRIHQIVKSEGITLKKWGNEPENLPRNHKTPCQPRIAPTEGGGPVSQVASGTIGELLAAADLMARGWLVFFPFMQTGRCDLVAISQDGKRVRRIEVRTGHRGPGGQPRYRKSSERAVSDHYAIVFAGEPVFYEPPIEPGRD